MSKIGKLCVKKKQCIVPKCNSHFNIANKVSLHRFPNDCELKVKWIKAISTSDWMPIIKTNSKICSAHFEPKFLKKLGKDKYFLTNNAIPISNEMQLTNEISPEHLIMENILTSSSCSIAVTPNTEQRLNEKYKHKNGKTLQLRKVCKNNMKRLNSIQQKNRIHKRKIENLQTLFRQLEAKNLISPDISDLISSSSSVTPEIFEQHSMKANNNIVPKQYSPTLRSFASTLNFFSPNAYAYVRKVFNLYLPRPNSFSEWSMSMDGSPGFTHEAFKALKNASTNAKLLKKENLLCSLVVDEIPIRKHVEWDGKMNHGYINLGNNLIEDTTEVAKDALVFMVVAVNASWKLPVAYFLTSSLNGEQKAVLVRECIKKVEVCNIKVISLTFDGTSSNITMARSLGCNLENEIEGPCFTVNNHKIRIFFDPCHTIKLIRNALRDKKMLFRDNGDVIKWAYLQNLHILQQEGKMHLGNKVRTPHLNHHKQKTKVIHPVQVFSQSIENSLEFCYKELNLPQFEKCEATLLFVRHIHKCYDILTSHKIFGIKFKKAICEQNMNDISDYLHKAVLYIRSIKYENRRTGFQGLIIGLKNICEIYKDYVATGLLKCFPTSKIAQGNIRVLFSSIGSRSGNTTARQFRATYIRHIRSQIRQNGIGTCLPQEDIFTSSCSSSVIQINNSIKSNFNLIFTNLNKEVHVENFEPLSKCTEYITNYTAGFVAYKLKNTLKCPVCIHALSAEEADYDYEHALISYRTKRELCFPSKDLLKITKYCEFLFRQIVDFNEKNLILKLTSKTIINFFEDNIFVSLSEHILELEPTDNHLSLLLKAICEIYFQTRINYENRIQYHKVNIINPFTKIKR